ncbi:hypothetical protein QO011_003097 [Labrys wisconsinensis]|uniref:Uncharacterized protein n=1 Tax=Labrys wisconsinensis TaxID=425677 RepID=A0ABU0J740_9HYPH|nr:hypothetical protein [Labrys wisconsinensis]
MAQELPVAAAYHNGGAFDQSDNGVAQRRSLPRIGGDARISEYRLGDFAIAGAVLAAVGCLQHQPQASSLLFGYARVFDRRASA